MAANFDQVFQLAAAQQGLDPNILKAIAQQESSMNPQAVNPESGAAGVMGFMPATAKAYGIDPMDPSQAIPAAAQMFKESLTRSGGDVSRAVADHFAGPDPKLHGPKTAAYVQQVAAKFNALGASQAAAGPSVDDWLGKSPAGSAPQAAAGPSVDDWLGKTVAPAVAGGYAYSEGPALPGTENNQRIEVGGTSASATPVAGPSTADNIAHQLGLTLRGGIGGVMGLPNMVGDAANSAINLGASGLNRLAGTNIPQLQMPSQAAQELMDKVGISQPQNDIERGVLGATTAMAGAGGSMALVKALAQSASPVTQAVGKGLTSLPGMQVLGAAGAGGAGAAAGAAGAGPLGQLGAAIAGGALGAVAPSAVTSAIRAPGAVVNNIAGVAAPFINPQKFVGSQLAQALGGDARNVAENIKAAPEFVPGSYPTTAQAGANPLLVATEKASANAIPDLKIALAQRAAENNAARWKALNGVSLTPEELESAKEARAAITGPLYDEAHQQTANVGKGFINFAQRPAVQQAMRDADILARNEGVNLKWPTPQDRAISGQALDYTTRALSDKISTLQRSGSPQEVRALTDAKNYITNWMEQYVPGVGEAASDYRTLSSPINTMEAGQQIAGALGTRSMDAAGLPQITLGPYKTALVKALKDQPYGIDPGAHEALQGVGQDLQRATISNSLGSPGSDTAYNIAANGWLAKQIYGEHYQGSTGLGKTAGAIAATATGHPFIGLGILGGAGNQLGRTVGAKLNAQLQDLLLNPNKLLPFLEAQKANSPRSAALANALRGNVNQGTVGAAVGSTSRP